MLKKLLFILSCIAVMNFANAQTLIISEVADGTGAGGYPKIVELTNTGATTYSLEGLKLKLYTNGNTTPNSTFTFPVFDLPSGQSLVLTNIDNVTAGQLWSEFNLTAPANVIYVVGAVNSNGDDVYQLTDAADVVIDIYGEVGVDGTGQVWEFLDSYAYRNIEIVNGNPVFTASEWTIAGPDVLAPHAADLSAFLTPGTHTFNPSTAPVITNIVINPLDPTSTDAVNVFADVAPQGVASITSVKLFWGTVSGSLTNEIVMNMVSGSTYGTSSAIPAQISGTTVYYKVEAIDNTPVTSTSVEMSYFIGNLAPVISSILITPVAPNETETVSVSATVTDDNAVGTVTLWWSTDGIIFANSINMSVSTGDTYVTDSQIPAQVVGTTVSYFINAGDNETATTNSDTLSYTTVLAPGSFTFMNGGFEDWTSGAPDYWTTIDSDILVTEETSTIYEGLKSARIELISVDQTNADIRQTVSVFAGATYTFSVMVYQTDTFARARLFAGDFQGYSDPLVTGEWQMVSYDYVADADADIEVGLRFYDRPGFTTSSVFYVDGFGMVDITGICCTINSENIALFPNPAKEVINISASDKLSSFIITDISGKIVVSERINSSMINVEELESGLHFITLTGNDGKIYRSKFIKL